jgi:hypothetical protein
MLLQKIKEDIRFASYKAKENKIEIERSIIQTTCCENGICAEIDSTILEEDYVIIKIDNYFQKFKSDNTPKGVDCLILIRNKSLKDRYCLHLVELKKEDSSSVKSKIDDVIIKFQSSVNLFLKEKSLAKHFNRIYEDVQFVLVTKVSIDSKSNRRDELLEAKAFRNLLNHTFEIPLNPVKRTKILVSIQMKPHSVRNMISSCK